MHSIPLTKCSEKGLTALSLGNVVDVIHGVVPMNLKKARFLAKNFSYGFQIGSPLDFKSLGEAVLVNQKLFATSTDKSSKDYFNLLQGPEFVTSGMFLLPIDAKPSYEVKFDLSKGMPIYDFYNFLYEKIKKPLAFAGFMRFDQFHANHIESPPISGLDIFDNPSIYYTKPHILEKQAYGFIVGLMTNFNDLSFDKLNKKLEAALYNNPNEKTELLTTHAHIVTLHDNCTDENRINLETANKVLHLFTDQTSVISTDLKIFIIDEIRELS